MSNSSALPSIASRLRDVLDSIEASSTQKAAKSRAYLDEHGETLISGQHWLTIHVEHAKIETVLAVRKMLNEAQERVTLRKPPTEPVWDVVIEEMRKRNRAGFEKYKKYLTPFNRRSQVRDAYEETLDKAVYLRTLMLEMEHMRDTVQDAQEALEKGNVETVKSVLELLDAWLGDCTLR